MTFRLSALAAFLALPLFFAGNAAADMTSAVPASMVTGGITSQPIGHYEFCLRYKAECQVRSKPAPARQVTEHGWDIVHAVNMDVNKSITPMTDMDVYGREEWWEYPVDAGDCEDFVLLKRKRLLQAGFSEADLLITVVRKPDGEGHAVLTLRTSVGDYILDNLVDDVKLWSATSYTYLKRQASFDTGRWVTIESGKDVPVAALK
ncbi:transglutaminase-like cysteine peptidase [Agrobacterium vitis]|uniref:transglutaminase-like cysteine peptidase n=1 Tax=Agrobacterium vitis TaxID=373 RepID=UPI0015729C34|nr:transglutaminase-like cysteine peptidase [Agrobacterium vitis]NSZ15290.1 transglutaminase-like cysteine peptidase [Agrobacterium vitis]QZO04163.1 transglutaminase-like cysteine peptidase [Agrobacterium vitis]UJL89291.1 transglutaminase-like cysteine peptidase [Agrobacterium vitis]BCH57578.1 transglutaminase [Agrobacterium vitis]